MSSVKPKTCAKSWMSAIERAKKPTVSSVTERILQPSRPIAPHLYRQPWLNLAQRVAHVGFIEKIPL